MPRPVLNIADVEFRAWGHNAGWPIGMNAKPEYQAKLGDLGRRMGAQKLGYNVTVVPARCKAFPLHSHKANEEMFFIIEGSGELRVGSRRVPIRAGDCIGAPAGGEAHQIVNSSAAELRYIAIANRTRADVVEYPDSGRIAIDIAHGNDKEPPSVFSIAGRLSPLDYWEGEDVASRHG